jgi:hypothetical protein
MTTRQLLIIALVWGGLFQGMLWADTGKEGYGCATWGMTLDQVKECLTKSKCRTIGTNPALLMCDETFAGEAAYAGYRFSKNTLYQVKILFKLEATKHQTYLQKHAKVEHCLKDTYGEPQEKQRKTRSNPFENDAQQIATGRGYYQTLWTTKETEILLSLMGEKNKLVLSLQYSSIAHHEVNRDEKQQESQELGH